uniref:RING-type domain-containing protein n=1 Tax=Macrostomum lignano TaxID=282301 RepID=A0A1I8FKK7_9PLAT
VSAAASTRRHGLPLHQAQDIRGPRHPRPPAVQLPQPAGPVQLQPLPSPRLSDQRNDSNGPGTQSRQGDGAEPGRAAATPAEASASGGRDSEEQLRLRIYLQTSSSSCERGAAASATDAKDVNEAKADTATAATPKHPKAGGERWRFRGAAAAKLGQGRGLPGLGGRFGRHVAGVRAAVQQPAGRARLQHRAGGRHHYRGHRHRHRAQPPPLRKPLPTRGKSGHSSQSPAVKGSSALMYDGPPQSGTQKQQLHSMKDSRGAAQGWRMRAAPGGRADAAAAARARRDCQPSRGRHQSGTASRTGSSARTTADTEPATCGGSARGTPRRRHGNPAVAAAVAAVAGCRIELSIRAGEATCFESGRLKRARAEASATLAASAAQPPACRIGPLGSGLPGRLYWPGSGGTTGTSGTGEPPAAARVQGGVRLPAARAVGAACCCSSSGGVIESGAACCCCEFRGVIESGAACCCWSSGGDSDGAAAAEPSSRLASGRRAAVRFRRRSRPVQPDGAAEGSPDRVRGGDGGATLSRSASCAGGERAHLYRRDPPPPPPPHEATDEELRSSDGDSADSLHRQQSNAGQDGWWPEISQRRHQRHRQLFAPPSALRNGNSSDAQLGSAPATAARQQQQRAEPVRRGGDGAVQAAQPPAASAAVFAAGAASCSCRRLGSSGSSELVELELSPADSGVHLTSRRPEPSSSGSFEIAELELSPLGGIRTTHRRAGGYGSSSSSGSSGVPAELELQLGGGGGPGEHPPPAGVDRRQNRRIERRRLAGLRADLRRVRVGEREGAPAHRPGSAPCADRRAPALPASAFVQRGSVRGLRRSGGGRGAPSLEDLLGRRRRRRRQSREPPCRPPPPPLPSPPPTDVIDCARGDVGWEKRRQRHRLGQRLLGEHQPQPDLRQRGRRRRRSLPGPRADGDVDGGGHSRVCSGGSGRGGRRSGKGAAAPSSASDARSSLVVRGGSGPGSGSLQSGYSRLELRAHGGPRQPPTEGRTEQSRNRRKQRRSESGGETAGSGGAVAGPGTYYRFQPPPQAPVVWHKKPTATVREQTTQTSPQQQQQQQQQQAEPRQQRKFATPFSMRTGGILNSSSQQQQQPPASRRFSDASAARLQTGAVRQSDAAHPARHGAARPPLWCAGKTTIQLLRFHNPSAAGRAGQAPMRVRPPRFLSQQEEREAMYSRKHEINEARRRLAEATSEEEVAEAARIGQGPPRWKAS